MFPLFSGAARMAWYAKITVNSDLVRLPDQPDPPSVIPPVTYCDRPDLVRRSMHSGAELTGDRGRPGGYEPVSGGLTDDEAREVT